MNKIHFQLVLVIGSVTSLQLQSEESKPNSKSNAKKGPVVDLGTLDIEGEARQPNLQFIEGPAVKDQVLKKIFSNSVKKIETQLLTPLTINDFPNLKGKLKK